MTDNLKDMLNNIPIPDELDKNIELGFERADKELRTRRFRKSLTGIAAALAIIIVSTGIIGFDRVEAALKKALQYVPGYNVLIDTNEGEVLALQEQILYEKDDIYVKITGASKLDKNLNILVQSNYREIDTTDIFLQDENGNIISSDNWSRSGGRYYWSGDYNFQVKDELNSYSLLLSDMEIPFTLEKTDKVEDALQLGNHAQDKGISIIAIKKPIEDGLIISLLNQSVERIIERYPFRNSIWSGQGLDIEDSMYILNREGEKTYPVIPSSYDNPLTTFHFNIMDQEGLKLVLPYVKINYPNLKTDKIKIITPIEEEIQNINKVLTLGELEIEVVDARLEEEDIIVKVKYLPSEDEVIDSIDLGGTFVYGTKGYDDLDYVELLIKKKEVGKDFSIYFESPTTILLGDWVIDLD